MKRVSLVFSRLTPGPSVSDQKAMPACVIDEGALSFVTVIYFPIWILHANEDDEEE
jgi:hypothetical protein